MSSKARIVTMSLNNLLNKNLKIPEYQRPYEWTRSNVLTLLDDIYNEYKQNKKINLGTIILYSNNNSLEIVDGQQRIITLALLYMHFNLDCKILDNKIQCISNTEKRIKDNYKEIKEFISRLNKEFNHNKFKEYVKEKIEFFVIITKNQEESFQLFDGRNSKFKNLDPIDLLKAYHLGAINSNEEKIKALNSWDKNINEPSILDKHKQKIPFLFDDVLFNIYNWSLNKDRKSFEKDDIYLYKGYKENNHYNYVKFYNANNNDNYLVNKPFKEGMDFFIMVNNFIDKYDKIIKDKNLYNKIKESKKIKNYPDDLFNEQFYFINIIYYDALFLLENKFGKINKYERETIEEYIYKWSITHRINRKQVQYSSINKYIVGENNFFFECNKALDVNELYKLELEDLIPKPPVIKNNSSYLDKTRRSLWKELQ